MFCYEEDPDQSVSVEDPAIVIKTIEEYPTEFLRECLTSGKSHRKRMIGLKNVLNMRSER